MRLAMEAIVAKESIEATEEEFEAEIKRIADAYQMEADKVKSLVDAAAVKKDLAVNKAIDFVKSKANIVAGAAEEKKPAKRPPARPPRGCRQAGRGAEGRGDQGRVITPRASVNIE